MADSPTGGAATHSAERVRVWACSTTTHQRFETAVLDEVSDLLADPTMLVWVDVERPSREVLGRLQAECQLHPLAIEDAHTRHQRPKIDEYDQFYFIAFYAPRLMTTLAGFHVVTNEVGLFVGTRFLITLHAEPVSEIDESARRWRENAVELGPTVGALLYSVLDSLVDSYFPIIDTLGDAVDELQEAIFTRADRATLTRLTQLRRDLLQIRRVLAPEREVVNTLLRRDQPILAPNTIAYFYDVYDHIVRLTDTIDTLRDLLGTTVDAYLSLTSNSLNEVMKTLTGWSIILMSATLIAGIYGMNFQHMPELAWPLGYPLALGLMLLTALLLFIYFRRRNWL